jgi:hypothetical protein
VAKDETTDLDEGLADDVADEVDVSREWVRVRGMRVVFGARQAVAAANYNILDELILLERVRTYAWQLLTETDESMKASS